MRIVFLVVVLVVVNATNLYENCDKLFADFQKTYHQKYVDDATTSQRHDIFCTNMKKADELNVLNGSPAFGVSKYADRSEKEFSALLGRKGHARGVDPKAAIKPASGMQTEYVNWVERKMVTPVKNQGQCGSCWAHSAAEQIESAFALQGNALWELSPQQIASCTTTCMGCGGGGKNILFFPLLHFFLFSCPFSFLLFSFLPPHLLMCLRTITRPMPFL